MRTTETLPASTQKGKATPAHGYAASHAGATLAPFSFERRAPREHDVAIDIKFCGICHSDIHQVRNEWSDYMTEAIFPMVPGHEIAGVRWLREGE